MKPDIIRVFLMDDHEVVRRGVAAMLSAEDDIEVVGEAGSVDQALARIPAARPHVAVLDVRMPDGDGVEVCREVRSRLPELACLMLTSFDDEEALFKAVMAGAAGYVLKQIHGSDLSGPSVRSPRANRCWTRIAPRGCCDGSASARTAKTPSRRCPTRNARSSN